MNSLTNPEIGYDIAWLEEIKIFMKSQQNRETELCYDGEMYHNSGMLVHVYWMKYKGPHFCLNWYSGSICRRLEQWV